MEEEWTGPLRGQPGPAVGGWIVTEVGQISIIVKIPVVPILRGIFISELVNDFLRAISQNLGRFGQLRLPQQTELAE
jgi:hypothetical protein